MPSSLNEMLEFVTSPSFGLLQKGVVIYLGLLWLSIIIWVTRDSINRSSSLLFQIFAILINIAVPILGVLFYLIIRPSQTNVERYYEEMEHRLLMENTDAKKIPCEQCGNMVDRQYDFCPQCAAKIKKACKACKKSFPSQWSICPHCGADQSAGEKKPAKKKVSPPAHDKTTA